jgi:cell division protein FtsZ
MLSRLISARSFSTSLQKRALQALGNKQPKVNGEETEKSPIRNTDEKMEINNDNAIKAESIDPSKLKIRVENEPVFQIDGNLNEKAINDEPRFVVTEPRIRTPPILPSDGQLHEFAPRIVVAGVGGGGGNAINNMISKNLQGVDFLALNTDAQHLATTLTDQRVQLGVELTRGLGCGANPDAGRMAAEECREKLTALLRDAHMVFITAGMGGGTGTGAAPVLAEICYELDILTVAVVTLPFAFEGTHRTRLAMEGIGRLQSVVDTLIVIPNQNLFQLASKETSFVDAFSMADNVLLGGVKSITDLMTSPGLINLDFADVQSVMHGMGSALLGTGLASGENRAVEAATMALENPLLGNDLDIATAKGMLVNITGGKDMTLWEVNEAAQCVTARVKDESANIIFGSAYDESLEGSMRVSVVATGIDQPSRVS